MAPEKAENDREAFTLEAAQALLQAAAKRDDTSRWVAAMLNGMRQGECLGLTWDAIDLDGATVDVSWQLQALPYKHGCKGGDAAASCGKRAPSCPDAAFMVPDGYKARHLCDAFHLVRPKSKAGTRVIPLVPWMVASLSEWRQKWPVNEWGLVWPGLRLNRRGGELVPVPQTSTADRDNWYALQAAAGVQHPAGRPYVLHEARHTTATLLLEAGVDEAVIIAILGHADIKTSRGYMHVSSALARKAMRDISARLGLEAA
jgi:integrase